MKKIISIIAAAIILSQTVFAIDYGVEYENQPSAEYTQKFKDVSSSHWAFSYIGEMTDRGVLSGYPNGYFYPENPVTRAEFAKVMTAAAGLTISIPKYSLFKDVSVDEWYAPYVHTASAYLSGYTYADGSYYLPDIYALREDIAVALVKLKGYQTAGADVSMLKAMFTDSASISSSAQKYVATALEKGLISGYKDNTFRGQNTITRAEAATLLWRAYQYGNDNKQFDIDEEPETPEDEKPVESKVSVSPATTPAPTPVPEPVITAEADTIYSGDYSISDYCLQSESSGFFMTTQKMDMETWIEGFYYFNGTESKKIADYKDFGLKEMESDDGNIQVQCYAGYTPQEMYISDDGNLAIVFKGDIYSENSSTGTEEAYVTATLSPESDFTITDIKEKNGPFRPKYTIGNINGRIYNYIDGRTYSYDAAANLIYSANLINGGEDSTKVAGGMPVSRMAGLWTGGFGVLADSTFYTLSPDGSYELFYEMSDGLKINDNRSMRDIGEFYVFGKSVYIISNDGKTLRVLKKY